MRPWLDVNGAKSFTREFALSNICQLVITLPERIGWDVSAGLYSDKGTTIMRTHGGNQSKTRKIDLPSGQYTFALTAKRGAALHKARLKAICE